MVLRGTSLFKLDFYPERHFVSGFLSLRFVSKSRKSWTVVLVLVGSFPLAKSVDMSGDELHKSGVHLASENQNWLPRRTAVSA